MRRCFSWKHLALLAATLALAPREARSQPTWIIDIGDPEVNKAQQVCAEESAAERYDRALPACQKMRRIVERAGGMEADAIYWNHFVGVLQLRLGNYPAAAEDLVRAKQLAEKKYGHKHLDVAKSLNDLTVALSAQGKFAEAEATQRQAIPIFKELLGERDLEYYARSLSNLAGVIMELGKFAEAEDLNRQALALRKQQLGERDPFVAKSLNDLALALNGQGKYTEAEALHRQALALRKELLGGHSPEVAASLYHLADALKGQGKYAEAEALYRQSLALYKEQPGEPQSDTVTVLNNLATTLKAQGKRAEAEAMQRQAQALRKQLQGARHP